MIRYPGGKSGAGVYQRIINLIPPHRVYVEPFLGGGAILRHKRPAACSIAIDRDENALHLVQSSEPPVQACTFINGDAISYLKDYAWRGDEFVYCDPPYVLSTRRAGTIYKFEMTDADHEQLVSLLLTIPAAIMLSGYQSDLYDDTLAAWYTVDFQAMTRGGRLADERLWMNYSPPALLHDDQYLGDNFRERERIKRKRHRWLRRFEQLQPAEQGAIFREFGQIMRSHTAIADGSASSTSRSNTDETSDATRFGSGNGKSDESRAPSETASHPAISPEPASGDDTVDHRQNGRGDPTAVIDEARRSAAPEVTIPAASSETDEGVL